MEKGSCVSPAPFDRADIDAEDHGCFLLGKLLVPEEVKDLPLFLGQRPGLLVEVRPFGETDGPALRLGGSLSSGGNPADTGTVTFQDGNTVLAASVPVDSNGQASYQTATLTAVGSPHTITATYSGDASFAASSDSLTQEVDPAPLVVTPDDASRALRCSEPAFHRHH